MAATLTELAENILQQRENQPPEWDGPPIPFIEYKRKPFPIEALPDWGHDFVKAVSVANQVPADMPGMLYLAAVAASVTKSFEIQARPGWIELLGLYVIPLLETGNRKSGTLRDIQEPIGYFERKLVEDMRPGYELQKHELDIKKAQLEDLKKSYVKAKNGTKKETSNKSAAEIWSEIESISSEITNTPEPYLPTLLSGDCTEEKLIALAAENDGIIANFSAEGELVTNAAGKYSNQSRLEAILKGYSGDPIRQERMGRASQYIDRPCFTIAMCVQPIVMKELAEKPEFRHKGFIGRFIYCVPTSPLGQREVNAEPVNERIRSRYRNGILKLLTYSWKNNEKQVLKLSADANSMLADFERELEPKLGPDGELKPVVDWAAKLAGNIVRIAGILHLADHAGDLEKPLIVPGETMQRALLFAPYLINHAKIAYSLMDTTDDEETTKAKRVIRWIKDNNLEEFAQRDCHAALRATFYKSEELEKTLNLLIEYNWIAKKPDDKKGVGRKSLIYILNPYTKNTTNTTNEPESLKVVNVVNVVKQTNLQTEVETLPFWNDLGTEINPDDYF